MQNKLVCNLFYFWLLFCKKPGYQIIQGLQIVHNQHVFCVNAGYIIYVISCKDAINIPAYLNDILWIHIGAILKATNNKQKNISSFFLHLHSIDITSTNIEEATDILKYLNKNQIELF